MKIQAQRRTRTARLFAVAGCVVLVGAAAAACAAKVDHKAPEAEITATELATRDGSRHFRGPVNVVIDAARQHANLTAEQAQTIDAIERELGDNRDGRRALGEKLKSSAVAVLRSGTADSKEFEQSVSLAVSAIEEHVQKSSDALEEIHAILTPEQRSAVATALRARINERFGAGDTDPRGRDGFKRLASQLMLSTLQLEQLEAIKKELFGEKQRLHPSREELLALVDAFEGDDFAMALDAFRSKKLAILRLRVATAGKRTDSVLSIFTREQRELLADLILEGPRTVLFGDRK